MSSSMIRCATRLKSRFCKGGVPLLNECACAAPTRVVIEVGDDAPACGFRALVEGPVNKHCATDHEIARHEAPVTTVFAVVPVVAHDEVTPLGHDKLVFTLEGIVILTVVFRPGPVIDVVKLTG